MKQYNFKLIYKKYNKKQSMAKNITLCVLLLVFALITILYCFGKIGIYHINGWSAEPIHHIESLAFDYRVDFDKLKVGDFVTYKTGISYVTHQIVKIDTENKTVTTCQQRQKSDGTWETPEELLNDSQVSKDSPISEKEYCGKVLFSVPKLGLWLSSIKELIVSPFGGINIIGIISVVLAFMVYYLFGKVLYVPTYVLKEKQSWQKQKKLDIH